MEVQCLHWKNYKKKLSFKYFLSMSCVLWPIMEQTKLRKAFKKLVRGEGEHQVNYRCTSVFTLYTPYMSLNQWFKNCVYLFDFIRSGDADQISEAEDFFEQVCVEDFNTKEDVVLWKQVLNEVRRGTTFFHNVWDVLPFDQTSIRMHLMSHCKVSR